MRIVSVVIAAALAASPAVAQQRSAEARENALWQTVKAQRMGEFAAKLDPNFIAVYAHAVNNKPQEVAALRAQSLSSFALRNFQARPLDANVVLVTYTAVVRGTFQKTDISGRYNAASVWKRAGRDWKLAYHSEVKAQ